MWRTMLTFPGYKLYNEAMSKTSKTSRKLTLRRTYTAGLLALVLAGLATVAAAGSMSSWEVAVFDRIYHMSDGWRWFALVAAQLGNVWVVMGIVGLLFVQRKNPRLALLVFRNSLLTYLLVEVMKLLVNRPRPVALLNDVLSREIAVYGNGFPSGHTALATVVSLTLLPYLPRKLRWLPVAWIGVVGWSRIYLGVHAPLDVVGGFVVGALVILLADLLPWPRR